MIRPYKISDYSMLKQMLKEEGVEEFEFENGHKTFIYNNGVGFFTYRYEYGLPHLIHFYLKKEYRRFSNAVDLTRAFVRQVTSDGYVNAFIHAPIDKPYLNRLIQYFFRAKPYHTDDERILYFVTLIKEGRHGEYYGKSRQATC